VIADQVRRALDSATRAKSCLAEGLTTTADVYLADVVFLLQSLVATIEQWQRGGAVLLLNCDQCYHPFVPHGDEQFCSEACENQWAFEHDNGDDEDPS